MPELRVGVQVQPQHADYDAMRRAWVEAEELGVDAVFTWDHFYPLYGDPDGKHFESLALQAALAEATQSVQIGALVMCNSYRNPQYLADALRTVDHISGGRLIVGIGSGWFERDYDEYGYEFGTAGSRLRALARDLPLFKERLGKLNPAPLGDMPIMIGGGGEKVTLRIVAEHAQLWHTFADVETYRHKHEVLAGHCADVGRDVNEIESIIGVPADKIEERAPGLVDEGVTFLTVGIGGDGTGYDLGRVRELVQWRDATLSSA
jgi:probable F420-dependent oxidoreductase